MDEPRRLRLFDLKPYEHIRIGCACGRIVQYLHGFLQRRHKVPSDTLIYDLQYRLRPCSHCGRKTDFTITLIDSRAGEKTAGPRSETVIVGPESE